MSLRLVLLLTSVDWGASHNCNCRYLVSNSRGILEERSCCVLISVVLECFLFCITFDVSGQVLCYLGSTAQRCWRMAVRNV